jgi:hypothetical protein
MCVCECVCLFVCLCVSSSSSRCRCHACTGNNMLALYVTSGSWHSQHAQVLHLNNRFHAHFIMIMSLCFRPCFRPCFHAFFFFFSSTMFLFCLPYRYILSLWDKFACWLLPFRNPHPYHVFFVDCHRSSVQPTHHRPTLLI